MRAAASRRLLLRQHAATTFRRGRTAGITGTHGFSATRNDAKSEPLRLHIIRQRVRLSGELLRTRGVRILPPPARRGGVPQFSSLVVPVHKSGQYGDTNMNKFLMLLAVAAARGEHHRLRLLRQLLPPRRPGRVCSARSPPARPLPPTPAACRRRPPTATHQQPWHPLRVGNVRDDGIKKSAYLRTAIGSRDFMENRCAYFFFPSSSPVSSTARNAFCGMSTWPIDFIRFLPSFCFSQSLRLRVMSPP